LPPLTPRSRPRWLVGAFALAGAALLAWTIRAAGPGAVFKGVRSLGLGFVLVLVLGGFRYTCRAAAWRLCQDVPQQLSYTTAFAAVIAGDAVGNITPFGALASEPAKVLFVSPPLPPRASIASLAIENVFYLATVVVMLAAGTAALLSLSQVGPALRTASFGALIVTIASALTAGWVLGSRRRFLSGLLERIIRLNIGRKYAESWQPRVQGIEDRVFEFRGKHSARVLPIAAIEFAYHVAAVAEIWIVLASITGVRPGVITALLLEYINRTITIAFQFVPMWLGVDEVGTGAVTRALNLGAAAGISLALVRKARIAFWTLAGIAFLARRGISMRAVKTRNL
jgi:Lysylphosphatidylglycerol synthase TM region